MLKKANIQWSGKTLRNQIEKGQVSFDCAVQRNPVWDMSRKSLLIHSMIEGYPIPPFYFARKDDGKYDALDGQQRSLSIKGYLDGEFPLSDDTPQVIDENGFPVTVSRLKFSELPEWAQDNIKDYSLTIYYFEGITEEEIAELFFRINNGKPLTSVELTRVKAKSILKFQEIAKHEMIAEAITEAGKRHYNDENVAMQAWTLCFSDCRDFMTKSFRPFIESAVVTEEQVQEMGQALDYIKAVCDLLNPDEKADKRVLKKIKTRSHLVSCTYVALKALHAGMSVEELKEILYKFFDSSQTSVNEIYNKSVGSGSAKPDKVQSRVQVLDSLIGGRYENI
ncbi:uncharacterized conserved protein [Clostridium clostridioforme CAG:132]|uniref:Uncharacterized conserved protein n=1 Tax=[Clostridium] clostridioforme CAG:132 TaxID=1263065 RepID=R6JWY9_9FIRM|nr:DUF262 domain-containing protein [Enterocloster clostridioformis]CDB62316.1 uncharacterized conserved protein [[Clostridium] clostridioforme CAG:132]